MGQIVTPWHVLWARSVESECERQNSVSYREDCQTQKGIMFGALERLASQVWQLLGEKGRVEGQDMEEFYMQVMSSTSTAEFPSNRANSFKNCLPNPLELRKPGWKVGMSDLSLPSAIRKPNLKDPWLFRITWLELVDPQFNGMNQMKSKKVIWSSHWGLGWSSWTWYMIDTSGCWWITQCLTCNCWRKRKTPKIPRNCCTWWCIVPRTDSVLLTIAKLAPPFRSMEHPDTRNYRLASNWPRRSNGSNG